MIASNILLVLISAVSSSQALMNCNLKVDGVKYNLNPLGNGDHSVVQSINTPPSVTNITWYINPCYTVGSSESSAEDAKLCPKGSQSKSDINFLYILSLSTLMYIIID